MLRVKLGIGSLDFEGLLNHRNVYRITADIQLPAYGIKKVIKINALIKTIVFLKGLEFNETNG